MEGQKETMKNSVRITGTQTTIENISPEMHYHYDRMMWLVGDPQILNWLEVKVEDLM